MELSNLPFEELVELRNKIDGMIRSYKDGYLYICKVRSYGRNWNENINNVFELEELCQRYSGDDGIVDVYSYSNEHPYRIEFFGDEVESIRTFEASSQLSIANFNFFNVIPNVQ